MLEDILEESWTYQEIIRKGREEERQQRVQEQRETLLSFVQVRFPELILVAKQLVTAINDPETLHSLTIRLFAVQAAEEAKQVLMEAETQE
jgi:cell fate (sporulation/competence/biofilm development) regulator YlbF (YheA/YmcA/DUF963 family)